MHIIQSILLVPENMINLTGLTYADIYVFGIPVVFTAGFLFRIILFCALSAIISKLLKLDKAYEKMQHNKQ
jgi:hypothetical protein